MNCNFAMRCDLKMYFYFHNKDESDGTAAAALGQFAWLCVRQDLDQEQLVRARNWMKE